MVPGDTDSALIVPVPEAEPLVGKWRARYDLAAQKGVPAHITVLFPFVAPPEISRSVVDELASLFAGFDLFAFRLARVGRWPKVVYLAPEPAGPFLSLTQAVYERWPERPPYGGEFDEIVPHLSVAICDPGMCEDMGVLGEVERAIVPGVPIEARAHAVWLMTGNGRWSVRARFPLGG